MEIRGILRHSNTTHHYVASKNQSVVSEIARNTLATIQQNNAKAQVNLPDNVSRELTSNFEKYKDLQKFIGTSSGASARGNLREPFIRARSSLQEAHAAIFSRLLV